MYHLDKKAMADFIAYLFLSILLYRLLRFITTPWLRRLGVYRYYRRFFFIVRFGRRLYEIHLGTSWDFIRTSDNTPRRVLQDVLDGLLDVCNDIECGKVERYSAFRGYTYYFKPQTFRRFGFSSRSLNAAEAFAFGLSLVELAVLNCISHRRWVALPFHRVCIVQFTAEQLLSQRGRLVELRNALKNDGRVRRAA